MIHASDFLTFVMGSGISGALILAYKARSEKRNTDSSTSKNDADAAAVISETALELLAPLRAEVKAAREEIADLREEVQGLRIENAAYHRRYGPLTA
jgi:hypothetical protein